jgi:hypothetical protein
VNKQLPNLDELVPPVQTVLENDPEYLRAIGTLCVEIANTELLLADLLGSLLKVEQKVAHAIYFSPQYLGPRLAILQNAADTALQESPDGLRRIPTLVKEVRRYANRRNDIVQRSWGIVAGNTQARENKILMSQGKTVKTHHVPIEHVKSAIYSVRLLEAEALELITLISKG